MIKKTAFSAAVAAALLFGTREAHAQTPYQSAAGLLFSAGDGGTDVGFQYKTKVQETTAFQGQFAFGSGWVAFGADYQYEQAFPEVEGLAWYAGGGAQLNIATSSGGGDALLGILPQIGMEYKIPAVPLAAHLDYKPYFGIAGGGGVNGGRFTIGIKCAFK